MIGAIGIVWRKLVHDLGLYEHEFTIEEVTRNQFKDGYETPEEREERLHTEIAGAPASPEL